MIALVQTNPSSDSSATSQTGTWPKNTTNGNLIVLVVYTGFASFSVVSSITDSQSNVYTKVDSGTTNVGNCDYEFWYSANIKGGTTPTITANFTGTQECGFIAREYSGINPLNTLDNHTVTTVSNANPSTSASVAVGGPYELLVGWGVGAANNSITGAGTGFGNYTSLTGTASMCALEDQIVSSAGSYTASFVTGSATNTAVGIATFRGGREPGFTINNMRPHAFSPGLAR